MHDQHERAIPVAVAHRCEVRHAFIVGAVSSVRHILSSDRRCWLVVSRGVVGSVSSPCPCTGHMPYDADAASSSPGGSVASAGSVVSVQTFVLGACNGHLQFVI